MGSVFILRIIVDFRVLPAESMPLYNSWITITVNQFKIGFNSFSKIHNFEFARQEITMNSRFVFNTIRSHTRLQNALKQFLRSSAYSSQAGLHDQPSGTFQGVPNAGNSRNAGLSADGLSNTFLSRVSLI